MQPSEVRRRVLHDHRDLRRQLLGIERLAQEVATGERRHVGPMRQAVERLLAVLHEHMRWEDRHLAPAVEDADAWGPERAALLAADHREQRTMLAEVVAELQSQDRPAAVLAARLLELVRHLREDMASEEAIFLDPKVLRDDVIGIDVETG